jgi:predicted KAP-like P-loop ATPase
MTKDDTKHPFSADRPISSAQEDVLGRGSFAESLATAIGGWKGNDSLVVSLYGPWGSGKSSIKNMALEFLRFAKTPPIILEFNPWQWAGHEELARAFFHEVGLVLGRADKSKEGKKRATKWKSYAAYLKAGSFFATGVRKLVIALFTALGILGLSSLVVNAFWFNITIAVVGSVSLIIAAVLGWMGDFVEKVAAHFEAFSELHKLELSELKKELADLLGQLKTPLLVVVDDVDRLSSQEIKMLFQLVKANADFPKLIYLLLFQRDIVERSFQDVAPITGREYLEKIVQVGLDVPRIERYRLEKILFAGLDSFLGQETVGKRFDKQRWQNIFLGGLRPYFETLRDVHRYIAVASFHVSIFQERGSFNVNPIDLLALEVLRVFDPEIYQVLADNKIVVTGRGTALSQDWGDEIRKWVISVTEKLPEARREQVREILKQLFPQIGWALSNYGYGSGFEEGWMRDVRVCHPDVFDRYFQFTIPEGDISQTELEVILSLTGDRQGLVSEFQSLTKRGLVEVALDRLEAYKQEIDLKDAEPFVTAIFDTGDDLPVGGSSSFLIEPAMRAIRVIHWYLKRENDPAKRGDILKRTMTLTSGLYLPILKTSLEYNKQERQSDPDSFLVNEQGLLDLQRICLEKIRVAAENGILENHPKLLYILYRWREWASPQEPRKWVEDLVSSSDGLLKFLKGCVQQGSASGAGDYAARIYRYIRLQSIEDFVDPEVVEQKVKQISLDGLPDDKKEAIHAFQTALKRRREGKRDDDWDQEDAVD